MGVQGGPGAHWGAAPEPAGETEVGFSKLWKTRPKSRRAKPKGIFLASPATDPRADTRNKPEDCSSGFRC